jgi:hypothetical protein
MDVKKSKFDYSNFYGGDGFHHYAVNVGKYTKEEALEIYKINKYNNTPCFLEKSHVKWRAGINEDNEPCVGWWFDYSPTEKRSVEVWAFKYDTRKIGENDTGCCDKKCHYLDLKRSWCDLFKQELFGLNDKTRCGICHSTESIRFTIIKKCEGEGRYFYE